MSESAFAIPAPQMEMRIKLSPEARRALLDALTSGNGETIAHELEALLGEGYLEKPDDTDWRRIEDALTLIMLPPQRYALGMPAHDRCPRCGVNSRRAGAVSCERCGS